MKRKTEWTTDYRRLGSGRDVYTSTCNIHWQQGEPLSEDLDTTVSTREAR